MQEIDSFAEESHKYFSYQSHAKQGKTERYAEDRHGNGEKQRTIDAENRKANYLS